MFIRVLSLITGALLLMACTETSVDASAGGRHALIIVDMQNDFAPGGAIPTPGGDEITSVINALQDQFDLVVATQDWHPAEHGSFASQHAEHEAGDVIELNGLRQELWPDHAVQNTRGAELLDSLDTSRIERVFQKGTNPEVDSYSGFYDNGRRGDTGLAAYLESESVTHVTVVGLALDYCVKFTALDAVDAGLTTSLVVDASKAVNLQSGDGDRAIEAMREAGVEIVRSSALLN